MVFINNQPWRFSMLVRLPRQKRSSGKLPITSKRTPRRFDTESDERDRRFQGHLSVSCPKTRRCSRQQKQAAQTFSILLGGSPKPPEKKFYATVKQLRSIRGNKAEIRFFQLFKSPHQGTSNQRLTLTISQKELEVIARMMV